MRAGRSAIGEIEHAPIHELKHRIGAEIKALPEHGLDRKRMMTMDRFSLLAVIAAGEALRHAGLTVDASNTRRVGTVVGVGTFGVECVEENYRTLFIDKKPRASVFSVPRTMPSAPAGQISMQYGLRGPSFAVTSACASSNHAVASAAAQLRLGRADVMIAGGADAPLVYGLMKGWEALRALARETCRPFSADRDGLVIGEGAGMRVLETFGHATARGAPILAELAGVGMSADAGDIVAPTVEGPTAAMQACLEDAGLAPGDIDYINAHGTGTKANDEIETAAIRRAFGADADRLSVSSTKSMHAHMMGAAGAVEAAICALVCHHGIVPPTINYEHPDPDCDLDYVPNEARQAEVRMAMSTSVGLGGHNSAIIFSKWEDA